MLRNLLHNTFSVWHLQIIPKNFSNSHSITSPSGFCQSSSSSLASKSHSLLCRLQKLWSTAHATITLETRATLASSIKDNVRHRPFTIPNVHPTLTLAADNCLFSCSLRLRFLKPARKRVSTIPHQIGLYFVTVKYMNWRCDNVSLFPQKSQWRYP